MRLHEYFEMQKKYNKKLNEDVIPEEGELYNGEEVSNDAQAPYHKCAICGRIGDDIHLFRGWDGKYYCSDHPADHDCWQQYLDSDLGKASIMIDLFLTQYDYSLEDFTSEELAELGRLWKEHRNEFTDLTEREKAQIDAGAKAAGII